MNKKNLVKRYIIFLFGLFFNSFGVAFITKATLGASPIASIPYSLSLIIPKLSLGYWTILFSILLILTQLIILQKNANKKELFLQFIITFFFGFFIDLSMIILSDFIAQAYFVKIIALLVGCIILAFGAYLEIIANVVMLPGDAFICTISKALHKEYGLIRVISDSSMTVIAGILCITFQETLLGVREGTIIAALIVGTIAHFFILKLQKFTFLLLPENRKIEEYNIPIPEQNFVITISREFGSGGREIGKNIAEKLGIAFYDSELIQMAVKKSGYSEEFVIHHEEEINNSLLSWYTTAIPETDIPKIEQLFLAEEKILKEIALKESCVIVGRLANYILRDHKNSLHVFLSADMDLKIDRVMHRDDLSKEAAKMKIQKVETERTEHCRYFSHTEWGESKNYDISIKSSKYGVGKTIDILLGIANYNINQVKSLAK